MSFVRLLWITVLSFIPAMANTAVVWTSDRVPSRELRIPAARTSVWERNESLFRVRLGQAGEQFALESNPSTLAPGERVIVAVRGWTLFRIGVTPATVVEAIRVSEIGGYAAIPLPGEPWRGATRIRVPMSRDADGYQYLRASGGGAVLYEIENGAPVPARIVVENHNLDRDDLFWERAEQRARDAATDGESWARFLDELERRNVSHDFVERQRLLVPWQTPGPMADTERELRLGAFYLAVYAERQGESKPFNDTDIGPEPRSTRYETEDGEAFEASPAAAPRYRVEGPCLVEVNTRLVFPNVVEEDAQRYVVTIRQDSAVLETSFHATSLDTLPGYLRLDSAGRPLGRRKLDVVVVPPGSHFVSVECDRPALVRLTMRRKRSHVLDAWTNAEDPSALLRSVLSRTRELGGSFEERFLRSSAFAHLGLVENAHRNFDAIASNGVDAMAGAAARLERSRLDAAMGNADSALFALAEADAMLVSDDSETARRYSRAIAMERCRVFRRAGRHAEAAASLDRAIASSPSNGRLRILRAEARAWTLNAAALDDFDAAIDAEPFDPNATTLRQRFWYDAMFWQDAPPTAVPAGTRTFLDPFAMGVGFDDATRSTTDARRLPGLAEIAPDMLASVDVPPQRGDRPGLTVVCSKDADDPATVLTMRVDDGVLDVELPVIRAVERFTLAIEPGDHTFEWSASPGSTVRVFADVRLRDGAFVAQRWDERVYYPVGADESGVVRFPLRLDAGTAVRGFVRFAEGAEPSALEVRLDGRAYAQIEIEPPSSGEPLEFALPVSAGFHLLDVSAAKPGAFVCVMARVLRPAGFETIPVATETLPDVLPWADGDPNRTDPAASAYREGVAGLVADDRAGDENRLLDAVGAFTKAIHAADIGDPLRCDALVARGVALRRLTRSDLSERDARRVLDGRDAPIEARRRAEWLLASTLADKGDDQQAVELLIRLIANGLDSLRTRLELARLYAAIGEREAALTMLEAIASTNPDHAGARRELADKYLQDGRLAEGFALMESLEGAREAFVRRHSLYARALRAAYDGEFEQATARLDALASESADPTPGGSAERSFYAWTASRVQTARRLIAEWNAPTSNRATLVSEIAEFNAGWTRSPVYSWRTSVERHFGDRWAFIGNENLLSSGERWRAQDAFTGEPAADLFQLDAGSSATVRVVGPTWFRVDARPILPVTDPTKPSPPARVEIAVFERGAMRERLLIDESEPAETIRLPDAPDTRAGRSTRLRVSVPVGEHVYTISALSGVALIRPYYMIAGPDAFFLDEIGGVLRLVASPLAPDTWHMRALAETTETEPDRLFDLTQIENLDASRFEMALRELADGGDERASYRLGVLFADRGQVPEAIQAFERSRQSAARLDVARLKRLHARNEAQLRDAVIAYDAYCSDAPTDDDAIEELGGLLLELGNRATDIGERTYWFNRALLSYEPVAERRPERRDALLGRAAARRNTRWERLGVVEASATTLDLPEAEPVATLTTVRTEEALTHRLWETGTYTDASLAVDAIVSMTVVSPTRFRVEMFGQRPLAPYASVGASAAEYRVIVEKNGSPFTTIACAYETVSATELGQFDPGVYHLRFRLDNGDEYDAIHLRLYADRPLTSNGKATSDGATSASRAVTKADGVWHLARPAATTRYFVGTSATPIVVRVLAPTLLRLKFAAPVIGLRVVVDGPDADSLVTRVSSSPPNNEAELALTGKGFQTVTFVPEDSVAVRVYARVAKRAKAVITVDPTIVSSVAPPRYPVPGDAPTAVLDMPPPASPLAGGWGSFAVDMAQGRNIEGALSERVYPSYRVFGLAHRFRGASARLFHRLEIARRAYRGQPAQFDVSESLLLRLPIRMTIASQTRGYWQTVRGDLEKAGEFSVDARRYDSLAPSLTLISRVGYNYAKSSLDRYLRVPTRFASPDVYSSHRRKHERNLVIEETAWFRPYLDVIAYARAGLGTNRSMRPTDVEYLSGRVGARAYIAGVETSASYEVRRSFVDRDRKAARIDRVFSVDAEYGSWVWFGRRISATLAYVRSKTASRDYVVVGLNSAFTGKRRLTDYTSAEEGFEAEKSYAGW